VCPLEEEEAVVGFNRFMKTLNLVLRLCIYEDQKFRTRSRKKRERERERERERAEEKKKIEKSKWKYHISAIGCVIRHMSVCK